MANTNVYYREVRFIFEEELTQVYVRIEAFPDAPIGLNGWHHKTFPASKSATDIMQTFVEDSPILWPQNAPSN